MFKNIISYLAHSVCFCIIISALAVMTYSMYKNNLISVYSKFDISINSIDASYIPISKARVFSMNWIIFLISNIV